MKPKVTVCVDYDLYLEMKRLDINMSQTFTNFLREMLSDSPIRKAESELIKELTDLRKQAADIQQRMITVSAGLLKLQQDREIEMREMVQSQQKEMESAALMLKAAKTANILDEAISKAQR